MMKWLEKRSVWTLMGMGAAAVVAVGAGLVMWAKRGESGGARRDA